VDLPRLKVPNVARKQLDVPLDHIYAAPATRLSHVARGAVGEGRTCVCLAFPLVLDPRHLDAKSFLSLFLGDGADAQADTDAEVSLVNEKPTVREDGDPWCACLRHGLLRWGRGALSKAAVRAGKSSTNGFLIRRALGRSVAAPALRRLPMVQ
jgi:hypothetical protein